MAIRVEQPGAAKAAATAGVAVGKAQRAKEDRARTEREQARAEAEAAQRQARKDQEAARRKAQQVAMEWEMQKMQINSQRAFEREKRQEDYQLAAEDRAAERAIERIEFSKDLDFQYKTQERQRKQGVIDASRTALDKSVERGEHDKTELAIQDKYTELDAREQALQLDQPYVDPRATQQAANRETRAADAAGRAQEAHEQRMAGDPIDPFKQIQQADRLAQIISGFSENQDINPGFGKKIVPLAVKDEDGKWVEATPAEAQLYQQAKAYGASQMAPGSDRNNPHKPAATQESYDAIQVGEWYMSSTGKVVQKTQ